MIGLLRSIATSYRARLALGYVLVVAVLAGAWAWSLYGPMRSAVIERQRSHLRTIARAGALELEEAGATAQMAADALAAWSELRVTVVASDGTVLADSSESSSTMQNHADRPEIRDALEGRVGYATRTSATLGTEQLYVAIPATLKGGRVALRVSEPLTRVAAIASQMRGTGVPLLVATLAAAVFVGVRLSRTVAQPVLELSRAAQEMASGRLDVPIPRVEGDLAGLADALGGLRDEIRSRISQLEAGQEALRAVFDGLPVAVFLVEDGRVTVSNRAASRMFRAPSGGWVGNTLEEGLPVSLARHVAAITAGAEPATVETSADPSGRYHRLTAASLEGPRSRSVVVISDITEVGRLDQVRRDFVANASHELKTPAAAIHLLAEAAVAAAADDDAEIALEFTRRLAEESDRLRRLVADLLDLSRLETPFDPASVTDVREAVELALSAHRRAASDAGLDLRLDSKAVRGQALYARADPTDVAIALDNALANAISYTLEGAVTVTLGSDDTDVIVRVGDTGPGIPPEHLDRVFERFYRVDAARTRDAGGTGLGLSLVRNAVERSGGSASIDSAVGEGTVVTLRLPLVR